MIIVGGGDDMIRRLLVIAVVAVMLLLLNVPAAHANVVFSNEYLNRVRSRTVELDRNVFIVNSETGYLAQRVEPRFGAEFGDGYSNRPTVRRENGQALTLTRLYINNNGEYWGIADFGFFGGTSGWYPMSQLLVRYDRRDFNRIHRNEFYEFIGEFDVGLLTDRLVTWQWPGSDLPNTVLWFDEGYDYNQGVDIIDINIHFAYRDIEGRQWGHVEIEAEANFLVNPDDERSSMVRGIRTWDAWICLDDPANETNIPEFNPAPAPQEWSPYGPSDFPAFNSEFTSSHAAPELRERMPDVSQLEPPDDGLDAIYRTSSTFNIIIIMLVISLGIIIFFVIRRHKKNKE